MSDLPKGEMPCNKPFDCLHEQYEDNPSWTGLDNIGRPNKGWYPGETIRKPWTIKGGNGLSIGTEADRRGERWAGADRDTNGNVVGGDVERRINFQAEPIGEGSLPLVSNTDQANYALAYGITLKSMPEMWTEKDNLETWDSLLIVDRSGVKILRKEDHLEIGIYLLKHM